MEIHICNEAATWYKNELTLNEGDFIRFFARYGGFSTVQPGFSLGLSNEKPNNLYVKEEKNGITYFIEDRDVWYFDNQNLYVDFNEKRQEPEFRVSI